MNWFRGLLRLWLVVAIPWIVIVGYLQSDTISAGMRDLKSADSVAIDEEACARTDSLEQKSICDLQHRLNRQTEVTRGRARADLVASSRWVLAPPLALAFVMLALAWVIRGFRRP
jgi:hypothetical protein